MKYEVTIGPNPLGPCEAKGRCSPGALVQQQNLVICTGSSHPKHFYSTLINILLFMLLRIYYGWVGGWEGGRHLIFETENRFGITILTGILFNINLSISLHAPNHCNAVS